MMPLGGADDPLAGFELDGRYRLLSLLGVGGMGFVYLAEQIGLGRRVAVKMLFAERSRGEAAIRRFAREARTLASLNHPGIVRILDYAGGGRPYLVMEFVQGPSLQRLLDGGGAFPPSIALRVGARIAEGLAAAHERGIVHRDLKPGNVHVVSRDDDFEVRILDFGLALLDPGRADVSTRLTRSGVVAGTPEYMSPEQSRGEAIDGRADLYALGIMLFELLAGAPPFTGESAAAIVSAHLQAPIPPLPLADVDRASRTELDALMGRLLAKDPNDRPADAAEVARTLARIGARLPEVVELPRLLGSRDPGAPTLDHADLSAGDSSTTAWQVTGNAAADRELEQMLSASRRRRRARVGLVSLVVVTVVAVAVPVAWRFVQAPAPSQLTLPIELHRRPADTRLSAGSAVVEVDPAAPSLITRPGGDAQAAYEETRRALEATLSARGLRLRDLTYHSTLRADFNAQDREARAGDYAAATDALDSLQRKLAAISTEGILDARLRAVEERMDRADASRATAVRALRESLAESSRGRSATRTFQRRLDGIERGER